jgi:hypothetical protein
MHINIDGFVATQVKSCCALPTAEKNVKTANVGLAIVLDIALPGDAIKISPGDHGFTHRVVISIDIVGKILGGDYQHFLGWQQFISEHHYHSNHTVEEKLIEAALTYGRIMLIGHRFLP